MKKVSFILSFLLYSALISMSQNIKHISLTFDINDFRLLQDSDGYYEILSDVHNTFLMSDTLLPALPYIGCNVLVRNTDKYVSHLCSCSKTLIRSNVNMAHNPEAIPTNMPFSFQGRSNTSSFMQQKYPEVDVKYVGTNDYGEYRLMSFIVSPFEYDAAMHRLYLKNRIDFDINLNHSSFSQSDVSNIRLAGIKNAIKEIVVNSEDLDNLDITTREMISGNNLIHQTGYEYVIVTNNQFKNVFQQLADWKSRKGIRSKVLSVDEIVNYSGSSKQEKIKRALADIDGLSYVLLGGDTLTVPTCMCYIGSSANADSITPADIYYSCLGTMNWDSNENGLYGETNENVSLIPSLIVSRAPVSTVADAQVFVNRIINYESAPDTTNWTNNILMSGTSLGYKDSCGNWYPYYDPITGKSDTQIWSEMIYNDYIASSNLNLPSWNGIRTRFYDTYTDISGDDTYDFNSPHLQNELSKGYTFADVMTHGSKYSWNMEGGYSSYNYNDARNLVNNGYTIFTTTACLTNAFDYSTTNHKCLSQEFLNNVQSGILAYWGTSRENYYSKKHTSSLTYGAKYDALTYRELFKDKFHRMGNAITEVKRLKMSSAASGYYIDRKIWMSLNLMGDPEMPVFLSKPEYFQNVDIQFVNDSIYVETDAAGFDICFVNQTDSTDYYIARNIETSNATFCRHNGTFDVCITSPGYIPKTMVCDKTYLQNKTLTGTKLYVTNNVMIGSNITNKVVQGPVVINSGSTHIKAAQGVTITKDFEVKIGAEFKITNE